MIKVIFVLKDDFGGNKVSQKKIYNEVYRAISEIEKTNFKTIEERIQCLECIDDLTRKTRNSFFKC